MRLVDQGLAYVESIIDCMREPLVILDNNFLVITASRSFYRQFQLIPEETISRPIFESGNGQWNSAELKQLLERIIQTHESVEDYKLQHQFNNDDEKILMLNLRYIEVEGDNPGMILMAVEDITERRRAEETLRESEARLQKTLEVKTVGVLFFRLDGYIHKANAAFERMSGYSSEELSKITHWKTLTTPEFWDITAKSAENIATTGQTPPYEKQMFRKDGSRWWGLFAPTRISGNGLNSECIEFIIDITERKRTDEELRESREMFAAAFRTVQDALIISNIETGLIIDVNQAWISHWGYSREESIGRRSTELGVFTDIADRQRALEIFRTEGRLSDFEIRIRTKSGELRDAILYVEQLRLHQKSLMLTIIHDITEHKRAENALHSRTEELENANRELKSFSYSVSHDLRSPITVIQGFSNILLEDYADKIDEHGRNIINHIITGTNKMSLIIEGLLSLGRISREILSCQEIDLGSIAESVINELRLTEPRRTVQVSIESFILAHADPKLMTITLTNLIGNAWKYTGKNPDARIDIGITTESDEKVYFIRDNGTGFDMQFAGKLFHPFQRLHKESEFTGTGVGLAIVHRIIHRHGGKIWAESQPGLGSSFFFTLNCRYSK